MHLVCRYCNHAFDSMFGPPHVKCPQCRSEDVVDPGRRQAEPEQEMPFRASAFQAAARSTVSPPQSVPPNVLNATPLLAASVALTLFCQPIGIVGIYFCERAKSLARQGQVEQGRDKLTWAAITVVAGWIVVVVVAIVVIALIALG